VRTSDSIVGIVLALKMNRVTMISVLYIHGFWDRVY